MLERLLARADNLAGAPRLRAARRQARRRGGAARRPWRRWRPWPPSWPAPARERLAAVQEAAASNPRAAATQVAFLRNLLARDVGVPTRAGAGDDAARCRRRADRRASWSCRRRRPQPAPADLALTFSVAPSTAGRRRVAWGGAVALTTTAPRRCWRPMRTASSLAVPRASAAFVRRHARRIGRCRRRRCRPRLRLPHRPRARRQRRPALPAADGRTARSTRRTAATACRRAALRAAAHGGWPADVDLDGDLDIVIAPIDGPAFVARNNGDGTFAQQQPFGACARTRGFAWADFDGEGVPDAACLDAQAPCGCFANLRGGAFEAVALPHAPAPLVAIAAADVTADGRADLVGLAASGDDRRAHLRGPAPPTAPATPRWRGVRVARLDGAARGDRGDGAPAGRRSRQQRRRSTCRRRGGRRRACCSPVPTARSRAAGARRAAGDARDRRSRRGRPARSRRRDAAAARSPRRAAPARGPTTGSGCARARPPRPATSGSTRSASAARSKSAAACTCRRTRSPSPIVHIGLGEATSSDVVRIVWPNGVLQSEFAQKADATIRSRPAAEGLVSVAVCVERPRDGAS